MYKLQAIISLILLFAALPVISNADPVIWTSGDYEIRSNNEWYHIIELQTYNDVTVKMYESTSVNQFSMYDNSELTVYGGGMTYLNLYDNATASFLGLSILAELYIDPASTAQVKLYANFDRFEPSDQYNDPYGGGHVYGNWLANNMPFNINLVGSGAYSHVQIVPEPTILTLFALGSLAVLRRRK
ncbi:MAG: PEP-CTERM sorting domain-containing protein [Sedimentisphaerales bacterium]